MTREEMIERLAAELWRFEVVDSGAPQSIISARTPEAFADNSDQVRRVHLRQAAAVLDLCGPKPLEWSGGSAITASGAWYLIFRTDFDNVGEEFRSQYTLTMSNDFSRKFDTLEAAQAAAQAHADAAHWANTKRGDL